MTRKSLLIAILITLTVFSTFSLTSNSAHAISCKAPACGICRCPELISGCQSGCLCVSEKETGQSDKPETTTGHVTDEFKKHRKWMIDLFFNDEKAGDKPGLRAAMKLMTSQLVAIGVQQVQVIGTFFDAKHQLETQRLIQQLTARAHKDYHPSEELCEFGTVTRSLAASYRNTDLTSNALSKRAAERQLLSKDKVANAGVDSDQESRLVQFIKKYCNKKDNSNNLDLLCKKSGNDPKLFNKDVSYTSTISAPLTLDLDFSKEGVDTTEDEYAIFALTANLFSHSLFKAVPSINLVQPDGKPSEKGAEQAYLDARAVMAKRSVAVNSIASIAALKSKGDAESQPFIYSLIKEMGSDDTTADKIKDLIGERPSYYAQMEVLTKKLYQSPNFYANLYDKPANVARQDVAIQAATLMQKRDLYRSYLRSEMVMAVMLETALMEEQARVINEINKAPKSTKGRNLDN